MRPKTSGKLYKMELEPLPIGMGDLREGAAPLGQLISGPILRTLAMHVFLSIS